MGFREFVFFYASAGQTDDCRNVNRDGFTHGAIDGTKGLSDHPANEIPGGKP
ncbi:hypothetical protein [Ferrovibrio terrae]|uniref:hypothetical protein n=1 Tax=Ferrovibrio terrae TaxID=2594003 RepID=UPI00163D8413|nr:hypothetical protein [Ferrovibrio terrae]